jgi:large subunit ribosomal protein L6
MKQDIQEEVEIPQGVTVNYANGVMTVKGAKGEIKRDFRNPRTTTLVSGNKISVGAKDASKREKKIVMTEIAHIEKMFAGVQKGHVYKLKICSSHFPMTASVKGNVFEVKNYVGETVPRIATLAQGPTVKIDGQIIIVEGVDKDVVSQTAAKIELLTRRPGFDKRIFQDGIYIIEKDGKPLKN